MWKRIASVITCLVLFNLLTTGCNNDIKSVEVDGTEIKVALDENIEKNSDIENIENGISIKAEREKTTRADSPNIVCTITNNSKYDLNNVSLKIIYLDQDNNEVLRNGYTLMSLPSKSNYEQICFLTSNGVKNKTIIFAIEQFNYN